MKIIRASVAVNHSTFDKGTPDCEVFYLYDDDGKSVLVSLYYGDRSSLSKIVTNCRSHSVL